MMPDLIVAATIFAFMLGLAAAAPIWGYDSRDGIRSDEHELSRFQITWSDRLAH